MRVIRKKTAIMQAWAVTATIILAAQAQAATRYWSPVQSTDWNYADTNWATSTALTGFTNFYDGDTVWFGSSSIPSDNPPAGNVVISAGGVSPAQMNIQRGFGKTYTFSGGDILSGTLNISRDQHQYFNRDGSYSFTGGVTITTGGGWVTAYQPASAGVYGFGGGTITLNAGHFYFNPGASASLTNALVVSGDASTIRNGLNGVYAGVVTVSAAQLKWGTSTLFKNTNAIGMVLTRNLELFGANWPSGFTLDTMITGTTYDVTMGNGFNGGGNADWRSRLAGTGGWRVRNVVKVWHTYLEVYDNPADFFTNITGKVIIQAGVLGREYDYGTPSGTYDITVPYELLVTPAATTVPTGTVRAATININRGATVSGFGRLHGTTINVGGATSEGILAPGTNSVPGTLTVQGNLAMQSTAVVNVKLAAPDILGGGTNDLLAVTGNLSLDGTVNITALGNLANGDYPIIAYGGTLTDNGLSIGLVPDKYKASIVLDTGNKRVLLSVRKMAGTIIGIR
jgi:fibronectin-binding autotransporter adhesin